MQDYFEQNVVRRRVYVVGRSGVVWKRGAIVRLGSEEVCLSK